MSQETLKTIVRKENGAPKHIGTAGFGTDTEVIVSTMSIARMITVRVMRMYLQTFLGLLGANSTGVIDLTDAISSTWPALANVALVALAPTVISLAQNALEFLTRIDVNYPQLRA